MQCLAIHRSQWLSWFKCPVVLAATLICVLSITNPADAGLLIDISLNSASPGTTGTLEVTLTNTGTGPLDILLVAGFSFEITADGNNVIFSDVTTYTTLYIFPGSDSLFGPGSLLPTISPDGHTISALDIYGGTSTGETLTPGETVSLGLVSYSLANSTPLGLIPITCTVYPATNVNDPSGNDLPLVLSTTGGITVALVPEPSSLVLILFGALGIGRGNNRRGKLAMGGF